jgi:predicted nucleic acid-binding Zn ribbon protein
VGDAPDTVHPLGESLDAVVRALHGPSARTVEGVFARWEEAVGAEVAAHAQPVALRDGCLVVSVDHPTWATQLRFLEADLLDRLGAVTRPGEITAIELRVGSSKAASRRAGSRGSVPPRW